MYPSTIFAPTNPTENSFLDDAGVFLDEQISNLNNEVSAIETKLGVNGSLVATTIDYLLKNSLSINPGHKHTTASINFGADENFVTAAQLVVIGGISGTNTGDEVEATGAEVNTGTEQDKYVSPKALADSDYAKTSDIPSVPVKATGAEVTTGADDTKFATPKALADAGVNKPLQSKVITLTRDLTTATGDVAYTGAGFTPTSLKAFGVVDGTAFVSEGFSDSAKTSQCMYQYGSNTWSMSAGLLAMSPTISAYQIATVKSYDADGFTLTWTKTSTPTGTATVRVICYK
jgi:hypothetical protein